MSVSLFLTNLFLMKPNRSHRYNTIIDITLTLQKRQIIGDLGGIRPTNDNVAYVLVIMYGQISKISILYIIKNNFLKRFKFVLP